jgi:hypothetical protein
MQRAAERGLVIGNLPGVDPLLVLVSLPGNKEKEEKRDRAGGGEKHPKCGDLSALTLL